MTEDFRSATEIADDDAPTVQIVEPTAFDLPPADPIPIHLEREIGRTRASITLMSGTVITGEWAAGDSQAFRRLIGALIELADGATARVDRSQRLISDMTAGIRTLRDQLRIALDDVDQLHRDREALASDTAHRIGELMAEVTKLQAATPAPAVTPAVAEWLRDKAAILRERDNLRSAFATEKRRADTAGRQVYDLQEQLAVAKEFAGPDTDIRQKALDAAVAADQAFKEAVWKDGARYLKLANMWTDLLNAVASSEKKPE